MVTQLPVATSVSAASVTSMILVESVKSTVALPLFWVTCAELPATDATRPLTRASPCAGADEDVAELLDVVGLDLFDELHAPMNSAVAPAATRIVNRVSRGFCELADDLADNTVSPIVVGSAKGLPADAVSNLRVTQAPVAPGTGRWTRLRLPRVTSVGRTTTMSGGGVAGAEAQMLDVVDGLVEQGGNVIVEEPVDDAASTAITGHQAQVAQQT